MTLQTNRKRIALITTWYPPITGVAVSRMNAFANYLSEEFDVEVFCLGEKEKTEIKTNNLKIHYSTSNKLFAKLKARQSDHKIIHHTKTGLRIFFKYVVKNPLSTWRNSTNEKLKIQHLNNSFDLIISSYAPQEAHLVAINFCKEFKNVPWIADMRDEMSSNPYIDLKTKNELIKIEKEVNKYASAITSVSKPIVDEFRQICTSVNFFEEIRNGFDHSIVFDKQNIINTEILRIGYFGTFYGVIQPTYFFKSLFIFKVNNPDIRIEFNIYGAHNNYSIPKELRDNVIKHIKLSYFDAINKMNEMDANIMLHPRGERKGVYSGKLFDYISAQKPIVACVDKNDVAAELIFSFDCGYVSEFQDVEQTAILLQQLVSDKKSFEFKIANDIQIKSLHRKNQVEKLAVLINQLTN